MGIRQAIIPMFLGGFRQVSLVGTNGPLEDPEALVWDETALHTVEAVGSATLAWNPDNAALAPHIHVAVGRKDQAASGSMSHLLRAEVQFIQEMFLQEVVSPRMLRPLCGPHAVPTLSFALVPATSLAAGGPLRRLTSSTHRERDHEDLRQHLGRHRHHRSPGPLPNVRPRHLPARHGTYRRPHRRPRDRR
ncbi:hypothetical protein ACFYWN_29655 [Streptomyces sp. NPDC002917]|uniref:hypothetical protein n=1 Tax=Streptomyces sp. NPDC002917 TaxID=3364671 RepID=UPI0036B2069D